MLFKLVFELVLNASKVSQALAKMVSLFQRIGSTFTDIGVGEL